MTLEAERGCGFRQPHGTYLISFGRSVPCDRLPVPLAPCACCGFEPKQIRSHQWLPGGFLGDHRQVFQWQGAWVPGAGFARGALPPTTRACRDHDPVGRWGIEGVDPICVPSAEPRLLMWVGRRHYTPDSFSDEANRLGVSKRIAEIPDGLVLGKTWVLLAHPDACHEPLSWAFRWLYGDGEVYPAPGVFHAMIPQAIELILYESEATEERVAKEKARGVDVVIIPDGAADARVSWRPGERAPVFPDLPIGPEFDAEEA